MRSMPVSPAQPRSAPPCLSSKYKKRKHARNANNENFKITSGRRLWVTIRDTKRTDRDLFFNLKLAQVNILPDYEEKLSTLVRGFFRFPPFFLHRRLKIFAIRFEFGM